MMLIDAHHHVWDLEVRPQPWAQSLPILARSYAFDDLRPDLAAAGVDATIVVQTVTVAGETPELLVLADREPVIAGVVGWVDLSLTDVGERLTRLRLGRGGSYLVGIRHQIQHESESDWFTRSDIRQGLRELAAQNLAYDLIVRADQIAAASSIVQAIPDLRFVLDHGGNPDIAHDEINAWRQDISILAASPNVAVKLSGLVTRASDPWTIEQLRPYADHLICAFGIERVLFGSDWPVSLLRCGYAGTIEVAEALTAGLTSEERGAIFGDNAAVWYDLAGGS